MKWKKLALAAGLIGSIYSARAVEAPVRIGVLTDMSSALSDTLGPGSVEGARMAIEDFGGTVLGRNIELFSADHQNKADIGSNIARRWFDTNDVRLIVDLGNSAVALAVQGIAKDKDRITIATGAATSELTGKACSPNSFHWGYDSYQFTQAAPAKMVKSGLDTWFFITADYAFGYGLENDTRNVVIASGGKVLGSVRHPGGTSDFSSFLLQAQASGAKVIAIASAVADLQNTLKQGQEFQIFGDKQRPAAMALLMVDVKSVGLEVTKGMEISTVFYWDQDDATRAFAKRFQARLKRPPSEAQAMNYSAVLHYLKSVKAAGTTDTRVVLQKMKETPVEDIMTKKAVIRPDGRLMRDVRLATIKSPE